MMVDEILEEKGDQGIAHACAAIMMPGMVDQSVSSFDNGLILLKVSMQPNIIYVGPISLQW